jgi:hypothetical protein
VLWRRVGPDRVVEHDQPAPVAEQGLDLDARQQRAHAVEHVLLAQHGATGVDRVGVGGAVARGLADRVGNDRGRLGLVEAQPARPPRAGELGGEEEQQALVLGGQQSQRRSSIAAKA